MIIEQPYLAQQLHLWTMRHVEQRHVGGGNANTHMQHNRFPEPVT
jgi:hypothetical protein